ncbi:low temperature requirement protein A [Actinomadura logoneensis]|uniref:Low temperature requirement protein A n=1 Tax=Actinomadura logoneensis TaxID=2293572 RepID=A0A372JTI2_9ACTN|nr:low temperature requirement protein A [Actinomadura logoneensis]RFU42668.1 low temperature requirement protein A [Actinomadura logoneensis]
MNAPSPQARPGGTASLVPVMRLRDGGQGGKVTFFELFFDLVFVFAVTQLSHSLLEHLSWRGAFQTLILLMAVWWAWMYTCWTTNWFDPDHPAVRIMLVGVMVAGLLMAATLPGAFGPRGLWFAATYASIQVGRTLFVAWATRRHELGDNFQRVLIWLSVASALWITGGLVDDPGRRAWLWVAAIAVEQAVPWCGFYVPGLGRSSTRDWTIDGSHMAERCQLFVIIALGESVLVTGATIGGLPMDAGHVAAFATAFVGSVALWWIYFDHTADVAAERIAASDDPGRLGRSAYTFMHIPMVAGIIVGAVADELTIAHPSGHVPGRLVAVALGGPILFVAGHALFKRVVFGRFTVARVVTILALAALAPVAGLLTPLLLGLLTTLVIAALALWDVRAYHRTRREEEAAATVPAPRREPDPSGGDPAPTTDRIADPRVAD